MENGRYSSLESNIASSFIEYRKRGHDENSWQWKDEGLVYAIQDYLSSCEMTVEDWEYAKRTDIDDIVSQLMEED